MTARREGFLCTACDADKMPPGYGGPLLHEGHFSARTGEMWAQAINVESVTLDGQEMIGRNVRECMAGTEGWIVYYGDLSSRPSVSLGLLCDTCFEPKALVEYGDVRVTMRPQPVRR